MAPPQKFHMFLKFEVFLWMPHVPLLVCIQGFGNSRKLGNGLLSWSMKLLNFWWVSFAWSLLSPSSCPLIFSFIIIIIIIIKKYKLFHVNKQDTMYQCHDLKMLNKLLRSCTMWDLGHGLRRLLSTLAAACYQCWWNEEVICHSVSFFHRRLIAWYYHFYQFLSIVQLILYETDEKEGNGRKPEGRRLDSSKAPGSPAKFQGIGFSTIWLLM